MSKIINRKSENKALPNFPKPQIVKIGPKGVITIPEENRRVMNIEPGKYLTVIQMGRSILLSPDINDFLSIAEQFQQKMIGLGLTVET